MSDLLYLPVKFHFEFEEEVFADNYPPFVIRSILGNNLRKISCISHKSKCDECMMNTTCVYASIFETILDSDNKLLPGTNRASHPFSITENTEFDIHNRIIKEFDFTITLFGKMIDYLPYIYASFVRAGEYGMFRTRTKFQVTEVSVNNQNLLIEEMELSKNYQISEFNITKSTEKSEGEVLVELKTPLRFKTNGRYTIDFTSLEFFKALWRRAKTILSLYGEENSLPTYSETETQIIDKKISWQDFSHYSARQKFKMELGGAIGTFKLKGKFSSLELSLLELSKIANSGKNTVFGLGQIDYWQKMK